MKALRILRGVAAAALIVALGLGLVHGLGQALGPAEPPGRFRVDLVDEAGTITASRIEAGKITIADGGYDVMSPEHRRSHHAWGGGRLVITRLER